MHSIFFSMGGARDTRLAAQVKSLLPDGLVYMYTRNGAEGTSFRKEIEAEVNACKLFVAFWSDDYIASEHAMLELANFKRGAESVDSGRDLLVIQTSRKAPNIQRRGKNPINEKEEFTLGRWRLDRAVSPERDADGIAELIRRKLESTGFSTSILVRRPEIQKSIAAALDGGGFYKKEFIFVSGAEGDGRRTAIKNYMEGSKHLLPKLVSFDNAEGPKDLLERLLDCSGESFGTQLDIVVGVSNGELDPVKEIRKIIHRFRITRNYLVLIMDRYSGVDPSLGIPKWVAKMVEPFKVGPAPLIFFVTSNPVTDELLHYFPSAGRARVPGLDELQMGELVFGLSHVDPDPAKWTAENQTLVSQISGSSPSLCQNIMRLAAAEASLLHLERLARSEEEKFSASLSGLLGFIVEKFKSSTADIVAMQVVEKLGVVAEATLEEIMDMQGYGSYDLYGMLQYGVFEQLSDRLLRIPPLLQRRLGFILWASSPAPQLDKVLQDFASREHEIDDGHGMVYMANKAAASLRLNSQIPTYIEPFISISMLFKTGVERYIEEEYEVAHSILRRAMDQLKIARYYGLAAARIRNDPDVEKAYSFLSSRFTSSKKSRQAQAMAAFLYGFRFRVQGHHKDALVEFEAAHSILKDISYAARQHGAVLTEISRSNLRLNPPKLDAAVRAAEKAYERQDALHNLNSLVKAKIYRLANNSNDNHQLTEIQSLLINLAKVSKRSGREFHLVREADLSTVLALKVAKEKSSPLDLSEAITESALAVRRSDRNQFYLWMLKSLHQVADLNEAVITEANAILNSSNMIPVHRRTNATKALIMSYSRNDPKRASQLLQGFREIGAWQRDFLRAWIGKEIPMIPILVLSLDRL
jgi:hypothetical protein